uniref:PEHE domain-containing protein n=1 Tax=Globodera pallida TaxID=36090 RepID=A0A183C337_GLOPA
MAGADSFRAQTEQAAIKIVTPFYKLGEKPSAEVQLGSSVADLSARFARADSDYKAERSAEHFRLQIIEPKVISHAHIPAHATRDYARRHLITDFPSLHGKRSFIDLEAIEQRKLRQQRQLPEAGDRDRDLDKFLKVREEKEQWKTPWPAPKPDDESLRELDRLRHNIDQLQKASMRRSKSLDELRPVKAEQLPLPPPLPLRRTILETLPTNIIVVGVPEVPDGAAGADAARRGSGDGERVRHPRLPPPHPKPQRRRRTKRVGVRRTVFSTRQEEKSSSSTNTQSNGVVRTGPLLGDRGEIGITGGGGDDDAEEQRALYEAMQRNLALHRQPSPHPDLYPSVPFNGPFFRLHELSPDGRASRPLTALPSGAAVSKTMPTTPSYHHHNTLPPASPRRPPPGRTTVAVSNNGTAPPPPPPPPGWTTRQLQEQRPDNHRLQQQEDEGEEEGLVVVWPPFPGQDNDHQQRRPKPEVPPPKNVRDNAQEYARQERMQAEAERQRAERDARLREKQFQAVKLQQDQLTRLATQQQASPADTGIGASEPEQHATSTSASSANRPGTSHSQSQLLTPSVAAVRVYETRPMAPDAGDAYDARFMTHPNAADEFAYDARFTPAANGAAATYDMMQQSPGSITWRRTYVVDTEHVDERNEILTSEERLARDRFEIDLLRRRAQFIEKPEQPVEIRRTGKRWQPPPEKPYRWPNPSTVAVPVEDYGPLSVQVNGNAVDEHRWVPVVRQPVFKSETRDFVPDEPEQQIKGHGAGPLEDVVQRQTAGVVVPSPDGSHRPKAEFGGARKPPAGGFIPHAPNVIVRRARTRALHPEELAAGSASDAMPRRRRHATGGSAGRVRHASAAARSVTGDMYHPTEDDAEYHPDEDWEAVAPPRQQQQQQRRATTVVTIDANRAAAAPGPTMNGVDRGGDDDPYQEEEMLYTEELPRHTSTVVSLGPLPRTDVRRTIRALEGAIFTRRARPIPKAEPPGIKLEPFESPMPPHYKEQIRDLLDSSRSSSTSAAHLQQQESRHSGYVTFNAASSFSPRSLVMVNAPDVAMLPEASPEGMLLRVRTSIGGAASSSESHASTSSQQHQLRQNGSVVVNGCAKVCALLHERAVVKVEAPPPIVRRSPVRREVVEVRREVVKAAAAPTIKHTVHRVEEKKRTEEVERRVLRKERRHKSRRMHRSHHSSSGGGAHQQEYNYGSWGGGSRGGYRSSSASRASRGAYLNGHGYGGGGGGGTMERHLPITYEGGGGGTRSVRSGGGGFDSSASDRYYAGGGGGGTQQQQQHARYGSLSDSLRHGDLKYAPNANCATTSQSTRTRATSDAKARGHDEPMNNNNNNNRRQQQLMDGSDVTNHHERIKFREDTNN